MLQENSRCWHDSGPHMKILTGIKLPTQLNIFRKLYSIAGRQIYFSKMNMMKTFLLFFSLAMVALSLPLEMEWDQWKQFHGKIYTEDDEPIHKAVWFKNYRHIQEHNSQGHSFKLGLNEFADMVSS